jgi:glycerol-3-phosphate responsive antiterminator
VVLNNYDHISVMPGSMAKRLTQAAVRPGRQHICTGDFVRQTDSSSVAARQKTTSWELVREEPPQPTSFKLMQNIGGAHSA